MKNWIWSLGLLALCAWLVGPKVIHAVAELAPAAAPAPAPVVAQALPQSQPQADPAALPPGWHLLCEKPGIAPVDPHQTYPYPPYIMKMTDLVGNYRIKVTDVPEAQRIPVLGDLAERYRGYDEGCAPH